MPWLTFAQLIIQVGLPLAEKIYQKVQAAGVVTQAEIDELKALALNTPSTQMRDALVRAGVPLDSQKAKELLALIGA